MGNSHGSSRHGNDQPEPTTSESAPAAGSSTVNAEQVQHKVDASSITAKTAKQQDVTTNSASTAVVSTDDIPDLVTLHNSETTIVGSEDGDSKEDNTRKTPVIPAIKHSDTVNSETPLVLEGVESSARGRIDHNGVDSDSDDDNYDGPVPPPTHTNGEATAAGSMQVVVEEPPQRSKGSFKAIFWSFFGLGFTAFGGPTANIARFHKSFVELRGWMSEDVFVELLALCQAMPGPGASQMSFAIGVFQKGILGGLLSGFLFQFPGFLFMAIAGFGAAEFLVNPSAWLKGCSAGLAAAAIALVAEAALLLGIKLCYDRTLQSICIACASITFYYQSQWIFPTVILLGGLVTVATENNKPIPPPRGDIERLGLTRLGGAIVLAIWLILLIGSILWKKATTYDEAPAIHWFESFYMTGSVTYGGGQVVLPLLEHSVVKYETVCPTSGGACVQQDANNTLVTSEQFFAGLALAQAMPGPLFNFAAYLGALVGGAGGIAACWLGLFGPGILFILGILPFWGVFRKLTVYKRALPGVNAAAIGLIYASVFSMGLKAYNTSPFPVASICIGMISYWATSFIQLPAPVAILGGGALGVVAWATNLH